jgi:8-oxo-dGTP diphosphatase
MEEHFVGKVAQKAIIENEGKVLIARDIRDVDLWELPGGRLNINETLIEGLQREIREELGILIEVHENIYSERFTHSQKNEPSILLVYRATITHSGEKFQFHSEEVAEVKWISKSELNAQTLYPQYQRALEAFFASR